MWYWATHPPFTSCRHLFVDVIISCIHKFLLFAKPLRDRFRRLNWKFWTQNLSSFLKCIFLVIVECFGISIRTKNYGIWTFLDPFNVTFIFCCKHRAPGWISIFKKCFLCVFHTSQLAHVYLPLISWVSLRTRALHIPFDKYIWHVDSTSYQKLWLIPEFWTLQLLLSFHLLSEFLA